MVTKEIKFTVRGQRIDSPVCPPQFAANTVGYIRAVFDFDSEWDGLDILAIWQSDYAITQSALDADGTCMVPAEVLDRISPVKVNLVGTTEEDDTLVGRLTTFPVFALNITAYAHVGGDQA